MVHVSYNRFVFSHFIKISFCTDFYEKCPWLGLVDADIVQSNLIAVSKFKKVNLKNV